ncbi:sulfur carrier protein ThiS (plasmid) [Deinococcus sp. PESE-38]
MVDRERLERIFLSTITPQPSTAPRSFMQVNGEPRPCVPGLTLHGLLRELDIRPERVAIAVNDDFYPGGQAPDRELEEADVVEIVRVIGGG